MVHITCTCYTFMKCKTTHNLFIGCLNTPRTCYVQVEESVALMDFNLWWFNHIPKIHLAQSENLVKSMERTNPEIEC